MTIQIYYSKISPPCIAVILTARLLELQFNLTALRLGKKKQHLKEDFLKINPQHTVPTIVDSDGFVLWESRVIMTYLVEKYGREKHEYLYPNDLKKRSVINHRLFFDEGTLARRFINAYYPAIYNDGIIWQNDMDRLTAALEFLNTFLNQTKYVAGDELTIADISMVPLVIFIQHTEQLMLMDNMKNIPRWVNDVSSQLPDFEEIHGKALAKFKIKYTKSIKTLD